jgi:hypothetical protein
MKFFLGSAVILGIMPIAVVGMSLLDSGGVALSKDEASILKTHIKDQEEIISNLRENNKYLESKLDKYCT